MAGNSYLISLITPVYNAVDYLEQAYESVRAQSIGFQNIQWLLVDDCSTDGSYELINSWAKQCPNIKVLRTPANTGTPAAPRNLGLDNADAPYIMFLDNDDEFFPDAMKSLYDTIESTGADIVTGDVELMNAGSFKKDERQQLLNDTKGMELGPRSMQLPLGDWIYPYLFNHWSKIFRSDIIQRHHIRALPGELWEDLLVLLLYMTCVKTMVHIDLPIINYRARRESLSHVYNKRYYCSLPRSIEFGFLKAEEMGAQNAELFARMLLWGSHVEHYTDRLLDSDNLSQQDLADCLLSWGGVYRKSVEYGSEYHSAYCRILADDFKEERQDKALFHFFELKALYKQRQLEKNSILNSNTYKLAKRIAGVKKFFVKG